jgi:hypothetical protein
MLYHPEDIRQAIGAARALVGPARVELKKLGTTLKHDIALTRLATNGAVRTFGQDRLSEAHGDAIAYIAMRLTDLATGEAQKVFGQDHVWLPYGLTCGGGKTLTATCWMAAVHALGRPCLSATPLSRSKPCVN